MVPTHQGTISAGGIRSQKLRYTNSLANLPKQVLRDILDTVKACNNSEQPFDDLKRALLGQFGKSKWQSYFDLLRLPLGLDGLKTSVLMNKLKQLLPHGVGPDNDLFLSMFLIRLPPSMQEGVGAGDQKTAAAMVETTDALWDARGSHKPMVTAARTQGSRSLTQDKGEAKGQEGWGGVPIQKVNLLPIPIFSVFTTPAMACESITITMD
jgi:hypothetical protein